MTERIDTQGNNPLSKKLNKILETRFDNDKVLSHLTFKLKTFGFVNNTASYNLM